MTGLVIGDDHSVFLDAMSAVLEQRGYEVTVARSVPDTIEIRRTQPDVCLIDRNFAGDDGITAIRPMLAASTRTKVLVLSADPDTDGIRRPCTPGRPVTCTRPGGYRRSPGPSSGCSAARWWSTSPKPAPARPAARQNDAHRLAAFLTVRERECLQLLVEGLDTAGIATKLGVSAATVRTHVQSLMTKLGVHSRLEAASYAVRNRLLDDELTRFPSAGTGLCPRRDRGQRRCAARAATVRPATAAAARDQEMISRVTSAGSR